MRSRLGTLSRKRVVITGMGAVTPIGNSREAFWESLVAGRSGIGPITNFDPKDLTTKIAGEVKDFDADARFGRRDARRMDRFAQFALAAADEAIADAALPTTTEVRDRTGAIVATGIGGMITIQDTVSKARAEGTAARISPFFIPMLMGNAAPAQISMRHGLRGPAYCVSSACASANDGIVCAFDAIAHGGMLAMVAGGAEAAVADISMGGFCSMKALSTRNDEPERASRPFDRERDGFVMAEGAGILVLEEREFAMGRGARIYGELLGHGQSADAYNLVAVHPEGLGVELALGRALAHAGIVASDVDYVNAHGTSTPIGDPAECAAVMRVIGANGHAFAMSSTKSMHGHTLGAAGGLEAIASIMAVREDLMPPTINYEFPDPECVLDCVPNVARRAPVRIALSNVFGFGGHNSVLVFGKHDAA